MKEQVFVGSIIDETEPVVSYSLACTFRHKPRFVLSVVQCECSRGSKRVTIHVGDKAKCSSHFARFYPCPLTIYCRLGELPASTVAGVPEQSEEHLIKKLALSQCIKARLVGFPTYSRRRRKLNQ